MSPDLECRLRRYVDLLLEESERQNLIARSTADQVWERHILDSLQLLQLAPPEGHWIDVGSGAGLPGVPLALASDQHSFTLIEPRTRRAAFLQSVVEELDLSDRVTVFAGRVEGCTMAARIISARAVAKLTDLFEICGSIAREDSLWLLPKGRSARQEVEEAGHRWAGRMECVPSITQEGSQIVVAQGIRRRQA